MNFIIILIIATIITAGFAIFSGFKMDDNDVFMVPCAVSGVVAVAFLVAVIGVGVSFNSAKYEAEIINSKYGTNYTQDQMFWGGNAIKDYLYGKTTNMNLNINKGDK